MSTTVLRIASLSTAVLTAGVLLGACSNSGSGGTNSNSGAPATGIPSSDADHSNASTASDQRCHASDLNIVVGATDSAAGSTYRQLEFHNTSTRSCTLAGYPGVSLVNSADGTKESPQVGAPAEREVINETAPMITLTPGDTATAELRLTNPGLYGNQCSESAADGVKIYLPDDPESTIIPVDGLSGCTGDSAPATLRISAIRA